MGVAMLQTAIARTTQTSLFGMGATHMKVTTSSERKTDEQDLGS